MRSCRIFTTALDFENQYAQTKLWLQIEVRPGATTGAYTVLTPRQEITPEPFALSLRLPFDDTLSNPGSLLNLGNSLGTGIAASGSTGLSGTANVITADSFGVLGTSTILQGVGVRGIADSGGTAVGVWGTSAPGFGVVGQSTSGTGGRFTGAVGVSATSILSGANGYAVRGEAGAANTGVRGDSANGFGASFGMYGVSTSSNGTGIFGEAPSGAVAYGVWGRSLSGFAGHFDGNLRVFGTLSKSGGSFKIDHPLDPANKYLSHSFVESPDMMNIYNGVADLDASGSAVIVMPDWFSALNTDFRYQLTAVGAPGPNLYIAQRLQNNRFTIAGGQPGASVSWQITGVRQDPWARAHRIPVEEVKPAHEHGRYIHPELYGLPQERSISALKTTLPDTPAHAHEPAQEPHR